MLYFISQHPLFIQSFERRILSNPMFFSHVTLQSLPCLCRELMAYVALIHQSCQVLGLHMAPQVGGDPSSEAAGGAAVHPLPCLVERCGHLALHNFRDLCTEAGIKTRRHQPVGFSKYIWLKSVEQHMLCGSSCGYSASWRILPHEDSVGRET